MLTPFSSIRWLSCKNATSPAETIPGFALMLVTGQEEVERQVVYSVARPNGYIEQSQNPAQLMFNGPTPIPPGQFGSATQDFPARVLHERSESSGTSAGLRSTCGPRRDSWKAWSTGKAFDLVAVDKSGASVAAGDELLWVTRGKLDPAVYDAAFRVSLVEIPSGGTIMPLADAYRDPASDGLPQGVFFGPSGLEFTISGSYLVGFSLSLFSNSAPRGGLLAVGLYYDGAATQYTAVRTQDIERDEYGTNILTTLENVCQAGPLRIAAGKTLELRNASNYPIFATPATLWAAMLFPHSV